MKKSFIYAGAILAATISLTNCTKEINSSEAVLPEGIPFEICANPTTKTAVEGLSTKWVAGDALNLFHAEAGSTTYTSDGSFSIAEEDLDSKNFKGTLASALEEGNYDWYAFYPYSKYNKTPAGSSQDDFGFTTIGGTSQTQTGNNSTAHLCGKACPLYGVAKSVASSATPGITMKHLASIIEVNVTNNSGEDLTVSSVSFTGTEDIVGTYYINFTQTPVVYTSRGEKYVSKTASLSVTGGENIEAGASAKFYIAIKPFTAPSGSNLTLSVNGYEKKLTLTKDIAFTAGHIKTLGFEFDEVRKSLSIDLNKDLYGVATGNNAAEQEVTVSGVTVTSGCSSSASNKTYYHDSHIRYYADSYLKISAPEAMGMTAISFSEPSVNTTWDGSISADSGVYDAESKSWSGDATDVTFSFGKQNRIASITIYYTGEITKSDPTWSISPETVSVSEGKTAVVTVSTNYDGVLSVESSDVGKATATINGKEITISGVAEGSSVIRVTGPETSAFKAVNKEFTVTVQKAAADAKIFNQTYSYGNFTGWSLTGYEDKDSYYLVPTGDNPAIAVMPGIFGGRRVISDVVITLNVATFGSGTNPSADTFTVYADAKCSSKMEAAQTGTLPSSKTFTNVIYTVSQENVASFVKDFAIKITKPGKQIRLKSIQVAFSYTE